MKIKNIIKINWLLLLAFTFSSVFCVILIHYVIENKTTKNKNVKQKLEELPIKEMKVQAYTKEFARRFNLPLPQSDEEPGNGLYAIEFVVLKNAIRDIYYTCLRLYIDNKIPIKYPENTYGSIELFFPEYGHEMFKKRKDAEVYLMEKLFKYHNKALIVSKDYKKGEKGFYTGIYYQKYIKNFYEDIAFLEFYIDFPNDRSLFTPGINIWLEKESGPDYGKRFGFKREHFFIFDVPNVFYKKAYSFYKRTTDHYRRKMIN